MERPAKAMTNSPASSSESQGFGLLDERIQRWIWSAGWTELREAQERAIPLILQADQDVIIAASTASGKTEAAFLPILSKLGSPDCSSSCVIYVSPLKALINDQWGRLESLAEALDIQVTPWHGDITQTRKTKFLKDPKGCLLITPESLEALLIRHGHGIGGLVNGLQYIVIDELHAFMGTERGKQLQSLMHRIEKALGRRICRVGLSATLGDMAGAADFLRPGAGQSTQMVISKDKGQELKVLVRGVVEPYAQPNPLAEAADGDAGDTAGTWIAADLFKSLRGSNNLVFPNRRQEVEKYADRLRRMCEEADLPNEFWPHHGSLAKDIREETEAALKQKERPATAICTTTLELGIDIGSVKSVAQIGPPPSVASLRQRLGRSGRRKGEPAILRAYCVEPELKDSSPLSDLIHEGLVQTIAMIQLLIEGWYEPVRVDGLHASTLVQQVLSSIAQHGGMTVARLWSLLCEGGPFSNVSKEQYLSLLKALGQAEIIMQDSTGLLLLAPKGERIVEHYSFYAAFTSTEEFRIVTAGRSIGSMPVSRPLQEGSYLIFAGKRWQVMSVDMEGLVIEVVAAKAGAPPMFEGGFGARIHDRVRQKMYEVLASKAIVPFLDEPGKRLLAEARRNFERLGLKDQKTLTLGSTVHLMTWKGDWVNDTIQLLLRSHGLQALNEGACVAVQKSTQGSVQTALEEILNHPPPSPESLAATVENLIAEKWDVLLPKALILSNFSSNNLDLPSATHMCFNLFQSGSASTTNLGSTYLQ